jgi:altronate dehydratase
MAMSPDEQSNAVVHHQDDNVAIAVRPVGKGETVVVNSEERVRAVEDVDVGHKIALCPIASGGTVYRYGEPIIEATEAIEPGAWVHVHNTRPIPGDVEM